MTDNTLQMVISKDGTAIAFDRSGTGPAIILVGGALEQRAMDLGDRPTRCTTDAALHRVSL